MVEENYTEIIRLAKIEILHRFIDLNGVCGREAREVMEKLLMELGDLNQGNVEPPINK